MWNVGACMHDESRHDRSCCRRLLGSSSTRCMQWNRYQLARMTTDKAGGYRHHLMSPFHQWDGSLVHGLFSIAMQCGKWSMAPCRAVVPHAPSEEWWSGLISSVLKPWITSYSSSARLFIGFDTETPQWAMIGHVYTRHYYWPSRLLRWVVRLTNLKLITWTGIGQYDITPASICLQYRPTSQLPRYSIRNSF